MYFNDTGKSSDKGILFNNYFSSVYTDNCPSDFSIDTLLSIDDGYFNNVSFTPHYILSILSSLDVNKAMGIDHLSLKSLQTLICPSTISPNISFIRTMFSTK